MPGRRAEAVIQRPRGRGEPTFTEKTDFLARWFSDPQTYPDEFKSWLRSSLVRDPNIVWEQSQIPVLPSGSKINLQHYAGIAPDVIYSDNSGTTGNFTNASCPLMPWMNGAGTIAARFDVRPTADCWWTVSGKMLMRVLDAAWYRANVQLRLLDWSGAPKSDAKGNSSIDTTVMHHSGSSDWANTPTPLVQWALVAGQQYRCEMVVASLNGGTWNHYRNAGYQHFANHGAKPRY